MGRSAQPRCGLGWMGAQSTQILFQKCLPLDCGPSTSGRRNHWAPSHRPELLRPALSGYAEAPSQPASSTSGASTSEQRVSRYVRPPEIDLTPPSIKESGSLRPAPEWFPAWMKYRRREENYVFWQDKFSRCSMDVPGAFHAVDMRSCHRHIPLDFCPSLSVLARRSAGAGG